MRWWSVFLPWMLALAITTPALRADVLFSQTSGSSGLYSGGGGFNITGSDFTANGEHWGYSSIAVNFTLGVDAVISRLDVGLLYFPDSAYRDVILRLAEGDGFPGVPSGNIIATETVTAAAPFGNGLVTPTPFLEGDNITLIAGKKYWVIATPAAPRNETFWSSYSRQSTYSVSSFASSTDGVNYTEAYNYDWAAFEVIGVQAPEPSSLLLLAGSGCVLLSMRHRGSRPFAQSVSTED